MKIIITLILLTGLLFAAHAQTAIKLPVIIQRIAVADGSEKTQSTEYVIFVWDDQNNLGVITPQDTLALLNKGTERFIDVIHNQPYNVRTMRLQNGEFIIWLVPVAPYTKKEIKALVISNINRNN